MDAIQKFLHDPAQYFSSRTDVGNARSRLTTQIEDAVTRLLRASRTLPMKSPDWNSWFKNPLFVTLLCKVYGTVTKEELLNVIPSNFPQSVLSQEQLLRALLGAVISHWVFERQHSLILKDPTERERNSTEDDLARGMLPFRLLPQDRYTVSLTSIQYTPPCWNRAFAARSLTLSKGERDWTISQTNSPNSFSTRHVPFYRVILQTSVTLRVSGLKLFAQYSPLRSSWMGSFCCGPHSSK